MAFHIFRSQVVGSGDSANDPRRPALADNFTGAWGCDADDGTAMTVHADCTDEERAAILADGRTVEAS